MVLILKKNTASSVPPLGAGVYLATCIWVVDIGDQYSQKFKNTSRKVIVTWEVAGETVEIEEDGKKVLKPRVVSETYTLSIGKKAKLGEVLQAWFGVPRDALDGFDLASLAGKGCQLSITNEPRDDGGVYVNVGSVIGLPKGMKAPAPETEILVYDIDNHDQAVYDKLPAWIRDKINASGQYADNHANSTPLDITVPTTQVDGKTVNTQTGEILTTQTRKTAGTQVGAAGPGF